MEQKPRKINPDRPRDLPKTRYFDVYDNSLVTAIISSDGVELTRSDGSPMWADGTSFIDKSGWDDLVIAGYFLPIDPRDDNKTAAKKIFKRLGE